jgi:phosphoribosylformylglycinamidine synthase subunit PurL
VRGLADGCLTLGTPVTGGNVSFYNQTGSTPIHPTPVVGVLGVHDDVRRRVRSGFTATGARIVLLGETRAEFGGSLWAWLARGHLGGKPPAVSFDAERLLASLLAAAAAGGLLGSAHDLSDGGLAVSLAESCLASGIGCTVSLPADAGTFLFSESSARAIVEVRPGAEEDFAAMCAKTGLASATIGTTGGSALEVTGWFSVPLDELTAAHRAALPALFG